MAKIEAPKVAPRWNPESALLYDQQKQRDNRNRPTLAIARKLVSYLLAVDTEQRMFCRSTEDNERTAKRAIRLRPLAVAIRTVLGGKSSLRRR
jgi:hypothetical protein